MTRDADTAGANALWGHLLVTECARLGASHFVVAPGSRSTPIVAAIATAVTQGRATARVITDERSAAFYALGYGRAKGRPAVLVTTSGSAMAHALPAVLEADADRVPMLLISADRPPELTGTGANQTAEQTQLLRGYVRHFVDMPTPDLSVDPAFVLTTIDEAVHLATQTPAGPVHLNCRFRKPLEPVPVALPSSLSRWENSERVWTQWPRGELALDPHGRAMLADVVARAERGLLVVGGLRNDVERTAARWIAAALGWPVFADITSGLCGTPYLEAALASEALRTQYAPDAVLHLGGRVVSPRLWQWVAESKPNAWVVARPDPWRLDPLHRVTHRLVCDIAAVHAALPVETAGDPRAGRLAELGAALESVITRVDATTPGLSEVAVARAVAASLPEDATLYCASSMPIRDVDRFAHRSAATRVVSNRGVSGIDGTLASAVGYAGGSGRPVTVLMGDQAFRHDVGSLGLLSGADVTVVVVNNAGGGIFSFLPVASHEPLHTDFFVAADPVGTEALCAGFDVGYQRVEDAVALRRALAKRGLVVEVLTDRADNFALHRALDTAIADAIDQALLHKPSGAP
ncbi:MAG: 2-succinyl-5-enolpyruvyl-6-hydroxy-3-cyclohexene-1-carboxylate synthase [Myxococcota bacterium]